VLDVRVSELPGKKFESSTRSQNLQLLPAYQKTNDSSGGIDQRFRLYQITFVFVFTIRSIIVAVLQFHCNTLISISAVLIAQPILFVTRNSPFSFLVVVVSIGLLLINAYADRAITQSSKRPANVQD